MTGPRGGCRSPTQPFHTFSAKLTTCADPPAQYLANIIVFLTLEGFDLYRRKTDLKFWNKMFDGT